jgi:hypothetical protein
MVARRARLAQEWRAAAPVLNGVAGVTGVLSGLFLLSHVPIVIGASSEIPLLGWVERVVYAAVMLLLLVTARALRLAVAPARVPADVGRAA